MATLRLSIPQEATRSTKRTAMCSSAPQFYLTTQTYTIQGTGGVAYSSCDVNRDGITNVADVQDIINQALGLSPAAASDLNGDGVVNAVDIQFVINASLNLGCAAVSPGTSSRSFTEAVSRSMIVPGIGTLSTEIGRAHV